ncbi:MAG: choice-of-anchor D domain-containing protein [Candidatus Marinimicrobia bacterium]|nr:choice-of-anchor D domain-containing protein [Candidatus Neomarinimicrobiota bacterium]
MPKQTLRKILMICTLTIYAISQTAYAQITEFKVTASDGGADDAFGGSTSISGDYAIVGAYGDDDNGSLSGSAYIFHRSGTSWSQEAKLTSSDGVVDDRFGGSVSISGDYAIVGAYMDDVGANWDQGSAYIFYRSGTSWSQQAKLTASDGESGDYFGYSVTISGDYVIVGAYGDDINISAEGSAYIFYRSGTSWSQQAKLVASDGTVDAFLGKSVSISGNYAIVGACRDDIGANSNQGSAYLFEKPGGGWSNMTETAKLTTSDGAADDQFGVSVAISGDYALVGSWQDDDSGNESGSAYLFEKPVGGWSNMTETAKLTASDGASGAYFGVSTSVFGDYAIVAATGDDDNGSTSGSAYIFHRDGTTWGQQTKLLASDGASWDFFGISVTISSAYVIVGAKGDDDNGSYSGSAYIYSGIIPAPLLSVFPLSLDLGDVVTGETTTGQVTVKNTGTADLTVSSIVISGADSNNFSIDTTSFTLTPGDSLFVNIGFTPDTVDSFSASLDIASDGGSVNVALAGNGIFPENTVTNTNDSGPGSLRQAILDANSSTGIDTIRFDIPGAGPYSIQPDSALPTITDMVIIDGTTQPGFASAPIIELDGTNAGSSTNGLYIIAGSSTVRGLVINRFSQAGIKIEGSGANIIKGNYIGTDINGTIDQGNNGDGIYLTSNNNIIGGSESNARNIVSGNNNGIKISNGSGNQIQGNYIGTDVTGNIALGNTIGVWISFGGNNTIGGTALGARNIVSGNNAHGIYLRGSENQVQGNYIGTDISGTVALGNMTSGVDIEFASNNMIGGTSPEARNIISGNNYGIRISNGSGNQVQGNYIGTDVSGTIVLGNSWSGVYLNSGASNTIGGTTPEARNIISGNERGIHISWATESLIQGNFIGTDVNGTSDLGNNRNGVTIDWGTNNTIGGTVTGAGNIISGNNICGIFISSASDGNQIQGNYIGTDVNGTADLGNSATGVYIYSAGNSIGGTTAEARNVISGNNDNGISIRYEQAINNLVQGNYIGMDAAGINPLGNSGDGVWIRDASDNLVGGTTTGACNLISGNSSHGVRIRTGTGNAVFSNSIFSNAGLGIKLGWDDEVTINDSSDADTGPNNLQNFPDLVGVNISDGDLTIVYIVTSDTNNSAYPIRVEFFKADSIGEEGQTFIGTDNYEETNSEQYKSVTFTPSVTVNVGDLIVATASDADSNTSEFSCSNIEVLVNNPPFIADPIDDIALNEDDPDTVIADLDDVFEDIEGNSITFSSSVSDENLIITVDSANAVTLSLAPNWNGSATAIFTASDGEYSTDDTVIIVVNEINDDPTTPVILLPLNGTEIDSNGYLVWTLCSDVDLEDILSYHIQLDDSSNFGSPEIDESGIGLSTILRIVVNQWQTGNRETSDSAFVIQLNELTQYENLVDNTIYFWRLRSLDNNDGQSDWTAGSHNFFFNKVNTPPDAVVSGFNPADGIIVGILTPTISWNAATDPDMSDNAENLHYWIQLDDDSDFIANYEYQYITDPGITSLVTDELTEDSQWYYRIQAIDDEDLESSWSETQIFCVNSENSIPSYFSVISPINGIDVDTVLPTFTWHPSIDDDLNDMVVYNIYLGESIEDIEQVYTGFVPWITDTTFTLIEPTTDNTTYYWNVVATDLSGATRENANGFQTFNVNLGNESPSVVELISPDSVIILTLTPEFHWTESVDPDPNDSIFYDVYWSAEGIDSTSWLRTDTNYCVISNPLIDNSKFYWFVNACDYSWNISQSDSAVFWTDLYPDAPVGFTTVYPEDDAVGLSNLVEFIWNHSSDPDPLSYLYYQLIYATDWSDSSTYSHLSPIYDSTTTIGVLQDNTEYFWLIEAIDDDGMVTASNSGVPFRFVVGTLGAEDEARIPSEFALHQNYPNPFNPITTIQYDLPQRSNVQITIYDLLGREVTTLISETQEVGYKLVQWNATNNQGQPVSAGMYFFQIRVNDLDSNGAGNYTHTRKMILLK